MTTKVSHISRFFENWAPQSIKLDYDNVGLLVGHSDKKVSRILTSLDLTEEVIDEAIDLNCDLIVSHHPLIFKGLKSIRSETKQGAAIYKLIRNDIAAFAAHTNLDAAVGGVSFVLAKRLGLENIRFLADDYQTLRLARVTVFGQNISGLIRDLEQAGLKENASLSVQKGTTGDAGLKLEIRYEKSREKWLFDWLGNCIPGYESGLEILALENSTKEFGMGAMGDYPKSLSGNDFLQKVSRALNLEAVRYTGNPDQIKTVAVCGGAGVSLAGTARAKGAQAFVTADIKYHDYFLEDDSFMLLDVGHYESEIPIVEVMQYELKKAFPGVEVLSAQVCTNSMRVFVQEFHSKQNPVNKNVQV